MEEQHLEEDVQPQVERAQQGNDNDEARQEPEEPVQVPASTPIRRSTRAGRGTTHKFDDYVRLEGLEASATYKNEGPSFFEEGEDIIGHLIIAKQTSSAFPIGPEL